MREDLTTVQAVPGKGFSGAAPRSLTWQSLLRLLLACVFAIHAAALAEETRKVKSNPPPEYPELARRLSIRGVARVQVTVAPDGTVKDVRELGGNPVLVDALTRAVRKWRYEPAEKTSVIEVKFDFGE